MHTREKIRSHIGKCRNIVSTIVRLSNFSWPKSIQSNHITYDSFCGLNQSLFVTFSRFKVLNELRLPFAVEQRVPQKSKLQMF